MLNRLRLATVGSEFLGTMALVLVALVLTQTTAVSYFIATSIAVAIAMIYLVFGGITGAHVNPAITFGMWTARRISTLRAVSYIVSQVLGALAALEIYQYLVDKNLPTKTATYSTRVWVAEAVGTLILALGISAALTRTFDALASALSIGAAMFVGIMVAATASAGYLNPAIALGVKNFNSMYLLGPLLGAIVGVNLYVWVFAPARDVVAATAVARPAATTKTTTTKTTRSRKTSRKTKK